jgi:hypothetical protein
MLNSGPVPATAFYTLDGYSHLYFQMGPNIASSQCLANFPSMSSRDGLLVKCDQPSAATQAQWACTANLARGERYPGAAGFSVRELDSARESNTDSVVCSFWTLANGWVYCDSSYSYKYWWVPWE